MFKINLKVYIITLFTLLGGICSAGIISRYTTFTDGTVLNASDLNGEFNQLVNLVNGNLDNDNISATAAISPAKITSAIAGTGVTRNGTTGALSVNTDNSTIEISSNSLRVKDDGITNAKLQEQVGLTVLGTATAASGNMTAITAGTDGYVLARSGTTLAFGQVQTAGIATAAITQAKLGASNYTVSTSSGSYSTSSASFTAVTNMSVTIIATGQRSIHIMAVSATTDTLNESGPFGAVEGGMSCSGGTGTFIQCYSSIRKDGSSIGIYAVTALYDTDHNAQQIIPCSSFQAIDVAPSAGSHTYVFAVKRETTSATVNVLRCKLVAYEI